MRIDLVAGDGFCFLLGRRGNIDRLAGVGEVGRNGFGDVLHRADLHDRWLGLLQHQLFVNGADLGLLLEGLLAAGAIFFGGSQWDVVFEVANAGGIFGVNAQECSKL